MYHLAYSATGNEISVYHLQSVIAACHCTAKDYASTDWGQILALYDQLVKYDASPVIALNRAVAVAEVHGPQAGLEAVRSIADLESLESYYLLHAVLGEFEWRLDHFQAAAGHFQKSVELNDVTSERAFLSKKLQMCQQMIPAKEIEKISA
jgi:RNA polymerase sigma-70 factor (ECF subfamily)